jgi:hypothetical protein
VARHQRNPHCLSPAGTTRPSHRQVTGYGAGPPRRGRADMFGQDDSRRPAMTIRVATRAADHYPQGAARSSLSRSHLVPPGDRAGHRRTLRRADLPSSPLMGGDWTILDRSSPGRRAGEVAVRGVRTRKRPRSADGTFAFIHHECVAAAMAEFLRRHPITEAAALSRSRPTAQTRSVTAGQQGGNHKIGWRSLPDRKLARARQPTLFTKSGCDMQPCGRGGRI